MIFCRKLIAAKEYYQEPDFSWPPLFPLPDRRALAERFPGDLRGDWAEPVADRVLTRFRYFWRPNYFFWGNKTIERAVDEFKLNPDSLTILQDSTLLFRVEEGNADTILSKGLARTGKNMDIVKHLRMLLDKDKYPSAAEESGWLSFSNSIEIVIEYGVKSVENNHLNVIVVDPYKLTHKPIVAAQALLERHFALPQPDQDTNGKAIEYAVRGEGDSVMLKALYMREILVPYEVNPDAIVALFQLEKNDMEQIIKFRNYQVP